MNKCIGFVSETGDSAFFLEPEINSIGIITDGKYVVGNGSEPLTEVNRISYAEFEINKSGNQPHLAFGQFETDTNEFMWLAKNQDNIVQVVIHDGETKSTYHLTETQRLSLSVVAGDLYIEIS